DIPYDFEPTNDNGDAMDIDLSGYETDSWRMSNYKRSINNLKHYPDVKFIASCWSPPAWMKDLSRDVYDGHCSNGPNVCGGHLATAHYQEFAEFMVAYYRTIERDCGVQMYGLSIQNELAFIEPYKSCVYTPEEYRDVLKVVRARFDAEGIDVRLFGAEDMAQALANRPYFGVVNMDPEAKAALDAVAVHGYSNGVDPTPAGGVFTVWSNVARVGDGMGKPVWMTETSGFATNWNGALELAVTMHVTLSAADLTLWAFWALDENKLSTSGLANNNAHTNRSYAAKQYYRYVRPGAVRIEAQSDDDNVAVTAYHHPGDNTLAIVLINWSNSSQNVSLSGDGLPQFTAYRSDASQGCANSGSVTSSTTLPAQSVTTLYGEGYSPSVSATVPRESCVGASVVGQALRTATYSLGGRRLSPRVVGETGAGATGVRIVHNGRTATLRVLRAEPVRAVQAQ
ncbi:MAG: hypothetical protein GF331_12785, partial [Chitinivibrionales bacterium]|nr:hypothetical protein [Chitinivibrionales bacterium]